jgi:hypothetical protein
LLPGLLERTRQVPTFFFIDPYSLGPLRTDRVKPLLEDRNRAPTEILMRIDPGLLARWAGWVKVRERPPRASKAAAKFKEMLSLYNIDAETVAARFQEGANPAPLEYLDAYLALFQQRFRYVQYVPIRRHYFAAPKYLLVHCTDAPHGAAFFNDAASTTEDDLFSDTLYEEAGGQGMLFEPERVPRVKILDAEEAIIVRLQPGDLPWIELRAELAMWLGSDLREKHHNKAAQRLQEAGKLVWHPAGRLTDDSVVSLVRD